MREGIWSQGESPDNHGNLSSTETVSRTGVPSRRTAGRNRYSSSDCLRRRLYAASLDGVNAIKVALPCSSTSNHATVAKGRSFRGGSGGITTLRADGGVISPSPPPVPAPVVEPRPVPTPEPTPPPLPGPAPPRPSPPAPASDVTAAGAAGASAAGGTEAGGGTGTSGFFSTGGTGGGVGVGIGGGTAAAATGAGAICMYTKRSARTGSSPDPVRPPPPPPAGPAPPPPVVSG